MISMAQKLPFCWEDIDELLDPSGLGLAMSHIGNKALMVTLENGRGSRGRWGYLIRVIRRGLLAKGVFQHKSIESLRKELSRNAQLRQVCGFGVVVGERAVPLAWVYSRFVNKLMNHKNVFADWPGANRDPALAISYPPWMIE